MLRINLKVNSFYDAMNQSKSNRLHRSGLIIFLNCIGVSFLRRAMKPSKPSRPLKNVFEAADARQKQAKKRSLCLINEHFESVFNTAAATQIVFQRPAKEKMRIKSPSLLKGQCQGKHLTDALD